MTVYTGCRACGTLLTVTNLDQQTCNECAPVDPVLRLKDEIDAYMAGRSDGAGIDWLAGQCQHMEDRPPQLHAAARAYAAWGWPVFPLLPMGAVNPRTLEAADGKQPATKNGYKDATTDFAQIDEWWTNLPAANIGLPTGVCFDVIDVDPRHDGLKSWQSLRQKPTLPDIHGRVLTASGGFHCYVEIANIGNKAGIYPGIDYRGKGGYVVAPPSQLDNARKWSWSVYPSPRIVPSRGGVVS